MKDIIKELEDFAVHCLHLSWRGDREYNLEEAWEMYKSSNSSATKARAISKNEQTKEDFYCVSSDALVYGKPCKEWCGIYECKKKI